MKKTKTASSPLSQNKSKDPVPSASGAKSGLDYNDKWVTDGAWVTGVTGVITLLLLGYYYHAAGTLTNGYSLLGFTVVESRHGAMLLAISLVAVCMAAVECIRLWRFHGSGFIVLSPHIKSASYFSFFLEALKKYLYLLLLFGLARWAYQNMGEYGFQPNNSYYAPWFFALEALWSTFLFFGFPYVLLTRAFRHDASADKKELAYTCEKSVIYLVSKIKLLGVKPIAFDSGDRKVAIGFAVKFFFCPVMTVFFFDNFNTLIRNYDYLFAGFIDHIKNGTFTWKILSADLKNIATSFIFTIDVGLAWVGYILSSRWLDNQTVSAEPTLLGWTVCLISYPPFRIIGGWFFTGPGESLYQQLPNQFLVGIFGTMMIVSYFVYMLPTIWFGVRFSNLTHRGIIRKGPYAIVRHPAYAAKNFAWWCVMFPVVIYAGFTSGLSVALAYTAGLVFMTGVYYLRAITEEQHLSLDPTYGEYCKHVRYRFIPGVI